MLVAHIVCILIDPVYLHAVTVDRWPRCWAGLMQSVLTARTQSILNPSLFLYVSLALPCIECFWDLAVVLLAVTNSSGCLMTRPMTLAEYCSLLGSPDPSRLDVSAHTGIAAPLLTGGVVEEVSFG